MKFFFCGAGPVGDCFSRPAGGPILNFEKMFLAPVSLTPITNVYDLNVSEEFFFCTSCKRTSLHPAPPFEDRRLVCAKVPSADRTIYLAMPPQSKRVHETESSSSASAPKRIRGSVANCARAGFEADPVMNSHCFTWQNASLKEPNEDTERYPWRMSTPTVGIRTRANTDPRGSDRAVVSSDDHEMMT